MDLKKWIIGAVIGTTALAPMVGVSADSGHGEKGRTQATEGTRGRGGHGKRAGVNGYGEGSGENGHGKRLGRNGKGRCHRRGNDDGPSQ